MSDISTKTIKAVITNTTPTFKASIVQKGADGKEVEFQTTATHIQWRYVDGTWANLVALADLKGADGIGDMEKATYDTDGNGIVDNAEKVNGKTVEENVPSGAKFTDTVYTHPNHTGDVTSVADGAQTIANGAVTLAKMTNINANTIIGRYTAGSGVPELLAIGSGLNTTSGVLKASIVDNLIADDTDKALSAAQGKALNTNIGFVQQEIDVHKAENTNKHDSEWINVMYPPAPLVGAKFDGTTDDTLAIQAILTNYTKVFFPTGETVVSDTLVVSLQNAVLMGSYGLTVINATSTVGSKPVFSFNTGADIQNPIMTGFTINLNHPDTIGIDIYESRNAKIIDNIIKGYSTVGNSVGIRVNGNILYSGFNSVERNYVKGFKKCIELKGAVTASRFINNNLLGELAPSMVADSVGVYINNDSNCGNGCIFSNNEIEGLDYGVRSYRGYASITNNRFETIGTAIIQLESLSTRNYVFGNHIFGSLTKIVDNTTNGLNIIIDMYNGVKAKKYNPEFGNVIYQGFENGTIKRECRNIVIGGSADIWVKVGQITFTGQYQKCEVRGNISTSRGGVSFGKMKSFKMSALQQSALGVNPVVDLIWQNDNTTTALKAIITTVDSTKSVIELYVYNLDSNAMLNYDIYSIGNSANGDFVGVTSAIIGLPAGTNITSNRKVYDIGSKLSGAGFIKDNGFNIVGVTDVNPAKETNSVWIQCQDPDGGTFYLKGYK